jgi:hypothetical protein
MDAAIFDSPDEFKWMQISHILDTKMLPLRQCKIGQKDKLLMICCGENPVQLGARIVREHTLAFQFQGRLIEDRAVSSWLIPYDKEEIMRYGQRPNTSIPPSAEEAVFPPDPGKSALSSG